MGAGGVTLALQATGSAVPDVPPVTITDFTPGTDRVVLWTMPAFTGAAYDLVVTDHPEGQTCMVRVLSETANSSGVATAAASLGSVIWLSDPVVPSQFTPSDANIANGVSIRCRNIPAPASQLSGVFANFNINTYTETPLERIRDRQFMSFFDDGTFLFATHGNAIGRVGVERGFYNYDPALGTLDFNIFLDNSTLEATYQASPTPLATNMTSPYYHPTGIFVDQPASLSNTLGYAAPSAPTRRNSFAASAPNGGVAQATNVTVNTGSPASISMMFSGVPINAAGATQGGGAVRSQTWTFTEPTQKAGQMTGAWVSSDNRRLWVYDYNNATGTHAGVNGPINLQAACYVFDNPLATTSFYSRAGGGTGCMTTTGAAFFAAPTYFEYYEGGFQTVDCVPNKAAGLFAFHPGSCGLAALADAPFGFQGRFPGTQGVFDERPPSPNTYTVTPGTPDVLTVQKTVNGVPFGQPVVLNRAQVKLD
jgi:hypothetical protein